MEASGLEEGLSASETQTSPFLALNLNAERPTAFQRYKLRRGITVEVVRGNILSSSASAIATSEPKSLKAVREVSKELLQHFANDYEQARQQITKENAGLQYGKVYPAYLDTEGTRFDTVYHVIVPRARYFGIFPTICFLIGKWEKYTNQAYRDLFEKADEGHSTSLAIPLLGCDGAQAPFKKAVDALISSLNDVNAPVSLYKRSFPKSLRTIAIYTVKEPAYDLLTRRLQETFGRLQTGLEGFRSPRTVGVPVPVSNHESESEAESGFSAHTYGEASSHGTNSSSGSSYKEARQKNGSHRVYKIESSPRGKALIIDNERFENPDFDNRARTHEDSEKLRRLFQHSLHFDVEVQRDLTAQEMRDALQAFSQDPALHYVDSMMVAILTHGAQGDIVYGTDAEKVNGAPKEGTYLTTSDIQSYFTALNCPAMRDKPKLFIGQFCRGGAKDTLSGLIHPAPLSCDMEKETPTPSFADMYFLYSTVPNLVAYRWKFVPTLCDIFQGHAFSMHIKDMATLVHNQMGMLELGDKGQFRTISEERGTLRKDWYFNPPPLTHVALESQPSEGSLSLRIDSQE